MKKILRAAGMAVAFVAVLAQTAHPVYAAAPVPASTTPQSQVITVATVNIQNATITGQNGNTVNFTFDITNRVGVQTQIKYGVMLVKQSGATQEVLDTKVYDETVSLGENDHKHITASYIAPASASGTYMFVAEAKNSEGLMLGIDPIGKVTFTATSGAIEIDPASCYLTVEGDTSNTKYALVQGVDVLPFETLIAHCDAITSSFATLVTAMPTFTTYYRSVFGKVVASSIGATVSFAPGKATSQSLAIEKPTDPQAYDAVLIFTDAQGKQISNGVTFHYVVHGESATIQNVVFDKDEYQAGNTANLSFFWSGPADTFPGSRLGMTTSSLSVAATVADGNGNSCAAPYAGPLSQNKDQIALSFAVTSACVNPMADVTIKDQDGKFLAHGTFAATTKLVPQGSQRPFSAPMGILFLAAAIFLIFIVAGAVFLVVKKRRAAQSVTTALFILFVVGGAAILRAPAAKADTFFVLPAGTIDGGVYFVVNMNKSSYAPNETIVVADYFYYQTCGNSNVYLGLEGTINGQTQTLLYNTTGNDYVSYDYFTATSSPGTYNAAFHGTVEDCTYQCDAPWYIYWGDEYYNIPYTVTAPPAGTINVTSENSQNGAGVPAKWTVTNGADGVFAQTPVPVPNAQYANAPADTYKIQANPSSAGSLFGLRSVDALPIAQNDGHDAPSHPWDKLLAIGKDFIAPLAKASGFCGWIGAAPGCASFPSAGNAINSLNLGANQTANFLILWNPIAALSASAVAPLTSNNPNVTQPVSLTLSNVGGPGSSASWNAATPSYAGQGSGWLTGITPSSGNNLLPDAPQTITATVNPVGLANGVHTATIKFCTASAPCFSSPGTPPYPMSNPVTVTITLTVANGPPKISPSPTTPVPVGAPAPFGCTGGSGSFNWTSTGSPAPAAANGTVSFTPVYNATGTYTVKCADAADPSQFASTPVTITPGCSLTASPTKVVVPQSTKLIWSCGSSLTQSCTLSGGSLNESASPSGGSATTTPASATTYTLACPYQTWIGSTYTVTATTNVNVTGTGRQETSP